jgi:L-alanine-DL-glutamate epimerase-like enolase superfamily enzyme
MVEPIPADAPAHDWAGLAGGPIPLAAGEHIAGLTDFAVALKAGHLGFLQPDLAKGGGPTGFRRVARLARDMKITICPHFLGGGVAR